VNTVFACEGQARDEGGFWSDVSSVFD